MLIPVVEGDNLVGVTSPGELMKRLKLRTELKKA
jgi:hypothetical protein